MAWPVRTTTDIITTDSAGRTVEAVPVYATDVAVQNAVGQWVDPAPAVEDSTGDPVRFVDAVVAQDSAGKWVDATPVSGVSLSPPTNVEGSSAQLRKLYNHVSRAEAGQYVRIGFISDSTVVGQANGGLRSNTTPNQLADILTDMGISARSDNFGGEQGASDGTFAGLSAYYGDRLTAPETVKKARQTLYTDTADANPIVYTPTKAADRYRIQYRVNTGQGSMRAYDDTGTLATIDTAAGALALASVDVSRALDAGTFTIEHASGGSIFPYLVEAWDSTAGGLNLINVAQAGWATNEWIDDTNAVAPLALLEHWAFDIYVIKLGKNDKGDGVSIATYKAGLQSMIDAARAGNPAASIVLEISEPAASGQIYDFDADWKQAIRDVAADNGNLIVVDTYSNYGSYEKNPQQYVDVLHPSTIGARREAELYAELFSIGRGVRPSWVSADALGAADFENQKYWRFNYDYTRTGAAVAPAGGAFDAFASDAVRITADGVWVEPSRTSFLASPALINNAAWSVDAGTARATLSGGPIAGQNATSITWSSGNGRISQVRNFVNGQQHHCMAIVKPGTTARYAYFRIPIGAATFNNYVFDLIGGTVGFQGSGSTNAKITALADGYFLIEFDWLCAVTVTQTAYFLLTNNAVTNNNFTAPTAGMDAWNVAYCDMLTAYGEASPVVASPRAADALVFKDAAGANINLTYLDDSEATLPVTFPYAVPTNLSRAIKYVEAVA